MKQAAAPSRAQLARLVAADSKDCLDEDLFAQVHFELETEFVESYADQLALLATGDS